MNAALAVVLLGFLAPGITRLDEIPVWAAVVLGVFCLPVVLVALLALTSAARPGSLGRAARRVTGQAAGPQERLTPAAGWPTPAPRLPAPSAAAPRAARSAAARSTTTP